MSDLLYSMLPMFLSAVTLANNRHFNMDSFFYKVACNATGLNCSLSSRKNFGISNTFTPLTLFLITLVPFLVSGIIFSTTVRVSILLILMISLIRVAAIYFPIRYRAISSLKSLWISLGKSFF